MKKIWITIASIILFAGFIIVHKVTSDFYFRHLCMRFAEENGYTYKRYHFGLRPSGRSRIPSCGVIDEDNLYQRISIRKIPKTVADRGRCVLRLSIDFAYILGMSILVSKISKRNS